MAQGLLAKGCTMRHLYINDNGFRFQTEYYHFQYLCGIMLRLKLGEVKKQLARISIGWVTAGIHSVCFKCEMQFC